MSEKTRPVSTAIQRERLRAAISERSSVGFVRAFSHALQDRETYDLRSNAGLWLGFVLALPIPGLAAILSAPPLLLLASLVAPLGWGIIVGASRRVGILAEDEIRRMRLEALTHRRVHDDTYTKLHHEVDTERGEREALETLQRLADAELELAQTVQTSLVASEIERDDLVVTMRHLPCTYVGGDYLQAALPRPDLLYLCVGDVSGHGVAAALVVSRIHGLVQRMIARDSRPGPFLASLNRSMLDLLGDTSLFMTFAVFRIDLATRDIEYATAGHPPQFLLRSGRSVTELFTPNPPIGLESTDSDPSFSIARTTFEEGDTLLLFTDGLVEVRESDGGRGMWGEERLESSFVRLGRCVPGVVAESILAEVQDFRGSYPAQDDVSLLVARLGIADWTSAE